MDERERRERRAVIDLKYQAARLLLQVAHEQANQLWTEADKLKADLWREEHGTKETESSGSSTETKSEQPRGRAGRLMRDHYKPGIRFTKSYGNPFT